MYARKTPFFPRAAKKAFSVLESRTRNPKQKSRKIMDWWQNCFLNQAIDKVMVVASKILAKEIIGTVETDFEVIKV